MLSLVSVAVKLGLGLNSSVDFHLILELIHILFFWYFSNIDTFSVVRNAFEIHWIQSRLISIVDVTSMNPYQPLPFHILSFAHIFQSRSLIYADSNICDS